VTVFPIESFDGDYDWVVTVLALQGIVNRSGPRLLLESGFLSDHPESDGVWRTIYEERHGLVYDWCEDVTDLIGRFSGDLGGLVVYDNKLDASRSVALTLAGLESLLPVCERQVEKAPETLPVVRDLRNRWRSGFDAYDWAVRELLPRCDRSFAHSLGRSHDDVNLGYDTGVVVTLDYSISKRAFVFNLSPSEYADEYPDGRLPGYRSDNVMLREILSRLEAPAAVYGWAEPEWTLAALLSEYNHYLMGGPAANLSFHAALEQRPRRLRQKGGSVGPKKPDDRVYLAFMTSEGDSPRAPACFFGMNWLDEERGTFPVNWGINPIFAEEAPAMMRYFYETATPNDYFFGGVGGAGYVFLDRVRDIELFARHARRYLAMADVRMTDHWAKAGGDLPRSAFERFGIFARITRQLGLTHLARGPWEVESLPGDRPIIFQHASLNYYGGPPEAVARKIRKVAGDG